MIWGILQRFNVPPKDFAQALEDERNAAREPLALEDKTANVQAKEEPEEEAVRPQASAGLQAVKKEVATPIVVKEEDAVNVGSRPVPKTTEGAALEQMRAGEAANACSQLAPEVDTSAQGEDEPATGSGIVPVDLDSSSDIEGGAI